MAVPLSPCALLVSSRKSSRVSNVSPGGGEARRSTSWLETARCRFRNVLQSPEWVFESIDGLRIASDHILMNWVRRRVA
jgi:hypothetical protein